jgi:hypothetical protein
MDIRPRAFFRNLQILRLVSQYIFSIAIFMVNNKSSFKTNSEMHSINTRTNMNFFRPPTHLKIYQKGPYYFDIKMFNSLPWKLGICLQMKNSLRWF